LADTYVEGLVHIARLDGDRYELDEKRHELFGLRSGRKFGMGDRIRVVLDRVDPVLRRVDLSLEGASEGQRTARPPIKDKEKRSARARAGKGAPGSTPAAGPGAVRGPGRARGRKRTAPK
jgi:ribonuclease R